MKVLTVVGTRPEAVKMAPVVMALRQEPAIESRLVATGQHRDMVAPILEVFGIRPDYDLDVMRPNQSPCDVLSDVTRALQPVLRSLAPDWVLVQGDTTTVLAAAIAAAYAGCRVGHVEAGLRTYDRCNPFPEELNRVLVDHASDLCFAPTEVARRHLLREGIPSDRVFVTGNTVVDALQYIVGQSVSSLPFEIPGGKRLVLVTAHRRENHGEPFQNILRAVGALARRRDVHVVYPVHRNPNVWGPAHERLGRAENVTLLEPMDYLSFVHLMKRAYIILTDSGGIQEEAPSLGIPVLVMRSTTERPEALDAGVARLVGTDTETILAAATQLLDDEAAYRRMASSNNPFGDGRAARRIVTILESQGSDRPAEG